MASAYPGPPQDDWGQDDQIVQPAPVTPQRGRAPPVLSGPPKRVDPIQRRRDEVNLARDEQALSDARRPDVPSGYRLKDDGTLEPIPGGPSDPATKPSKTAPVTPQSQEAARTEAITKLALSRRLRGRSQEDWFTGGGWQLLSGIPGSNPYDFAAQASTLADAGGLQRVMEMSRENGGKNPLTPLSNTDFQALSRSLTNLDPAQSDEQFQQALAPIDRLYETMYQNAGGTNLEADIAALNKGQRPEILGQGRTMAADEFGHFAMDGDAPPRAKRFPPDQEAEIIQAIQSGDIGQAAMLTERYSGQPADRAGLAAAAAAYRKDPKTPLYVSYSTGDETAQAAYDRERYGDHLQPAMEDRAKTGGGVDSAVRQTVNSRLAGLPDLFAAGMNTVVGRGRGDYTEVGKRFRDNLQEQRAFTEADFRVNPVASYGGMIAGGLAVPTRVGSVSNAARTEALTGGAGMREAARAARGAGARRLGLEGAAYGGISGTADNVESDNPLGHGAVGALQGGLGGYGIGRVLGGRLPAKVPGGTEASAVARAGAEEGVTLSRPIVDPASRDAMAYLDASIGGGPVRAALDKTRTGIEQRASSLGDGGIAEDPAMFGQRFQGAVERSERGVKTRLTRQYSAANAMPGNEAVIGREAVERLDSHLAELSKNPNANRGVISYLKTMRKDFVGNEDNYLPKDLAAARDLRTSLSGEINRRNLSATPAERIMNDVLDGLRRDIRRDIGRANPLKEQAFRRADIGWAQMKRDQRQVTERIVGPRDSPLSGGEVMARLRSMAKGDAPRLQRAWEKLDPQEQLDGAATIAETFGRAAPDEAFSPAKFISATRTISPQAAETIFGPEGARSIANLRLLSREFTSTMQRLNNSRSGMVQQWGTTLRNIIPHAAAGAAGAAGAGTSALMGGSGLTSGAVGLAAASAVAGAGIVARNVSARALMSTEMSRWLVQATRANTPSKVNQVIQRLTVVATRDPAVAQEALGLQDDLRKALGEEKPKGTAIPVGRRGVR